MFRAGLTDSLNRIRLSRWLRGLSTDWTRDCAEGCRERKVAPIIPRRFGCPLNLPLANTCFVADFWNPP